MPAPTPSPDAGLVEGAARAVRSAFAEYMTDFRAVTLRAKAHFEARDWPARQADNLERLNLYARAMERAAAALCGILGPRIGERSLWTRVKPLTVGADEPNFELARTFFNSTTRRIFDTVGVNPDIEFASPDLVIRDWEPAARILRSYRPAGPTGAWLARILEDYRFAADFRDLAGDVALAAERIDARLKSALGRSAADAVEMLRPVFYRNKAAYLMGRMRCGDRALPLILALLHSPEGVLLDAVLMREDEVSILFSFTRSYFHVDTDCPRELIVFLKAIIPLKPVSDLYSALGFNKHGKTELYRDLQRHLERTPDRFEFASGDRGLVMLVFTLPSYDSVFKVIRDTFAFPKNTTAREVIERYRLVYQRDRVGRLVEAQLFRHLEIRIGLFADDLLEQLLRDASRMVKREGDFLVFDRLYTERRVRPLNLYLQEVDADAARLAVLDYGATIKELAAANIFAGDFLLKNFGVTRHGRVVFYDYDELCLLTDCRFRRLPPPRTPEDELAPEPWFAAADNDVFPEEFRGFLGLSERLLRVFEAQHGELFTAEFWRDLQRLHREGAILDFFPYPDSERLHAGDLR